MSPLRTTSAPSAPVLVPARGRPWYRRSDGWFRAALVPLVILGALTAMVTTVALPTMLPAMATGVVLLAGYGLVVLWLIRLLLDRWRTVRAWPAATALLWGGLIATGFTAWTNTTLQRDLSALAGPRTGSFLEVAVGAPVVEETLKALGVLAAIVVGRCRLSGPLEGVVLGALSGLGFQLVEDFRYLNIDAFLDPNSDWHGVLGTLVGRGLTGFGAHWAHTALAGCAIGLLLTATRLRTRWLAVPLVVGAVLEHDLHNGLSDVWGLLVNVIAFAVTVVVAGWAARSHWRQAVEDLAADPSVPTSEDERLALRTRRTARAARRVVRRHVGPDTARRESRRQSALVRLATAHAHHDPAEITSARATLLAS